MCENTRNDGTPCPSKGNYWVQSRREIDCPGNAAAGVEPFKTSGIGRITCGTHLTRTVREISARNNANYHNNPFPSFVGVIVKVRSTHPTKGWDIWQ